MVGASGPRHAVAKDILICLHASGSSGRQWGPIAGTLSERFDVIAPDLLGCGGQRRWRVGEPVSLDDEARAIERLMPDRAVHLLGHSYGGAVALQIALRRPDRVLSLTLYEPVRFSLLLQQRATVAVGEAIVAVGREIGREVLAGALHAAAARFVDYWSGDGTWAALDERRRQGLAERMPKVRADFEALFADPVPVASYRALPMPVRLIGGSRSPLPARRVLDLLAPACPDATRVTLEGAGHMAPVETPRRLLDVLAIDAPGRRPSPAGDGLAGLPAARPHAGASLV
jgi:pimeloyl-ACP methyl ester carboxylesterase